MNPRASSGKANAFSHAIADALNHKIGMSGIPMVKVLVDAGLSRNYYYKRARYELPFNTNDISLIAQSIGLTPDEIIEDALARLSRNNVTHADFGGNVRSVVDHDLPAVADEIADDDHSGEDDDTI